MENKLNMGENHPPEDNRPAEKLEGNESFTKNYEEATLVLEELQKMATEEPITLQAVNILGRLSADVAALVVQAFKEHPKNYEEAISSASPQIDAWRRRFEDAAYKLRQLRKDAK